jgi:hypothetical protein
MREIAKRKTDYAGLPPMLSRHAMKTKRSLISSRLSVAQLEIIGQFNDYAFDYPRLNFEEVAKKVLGAPFPNTASGRAFKREAKAVFDQERQR